MADEIGHEKLSLERPALSGWPMVIFWAAMLIFACHACTHMVGAGDTWVAMACGRHFVNHGVNTVEPFSANSHKAGPTPETMSAYAKQLRNDAMYEKGIKKSLMIWWADKADNFGSWPKWQQDFAKWIHPTGWVNQNWLTHVIFYSLVPKSTYTPSDTFSSNALVYWKFAVYIAAIICVYFIARFLKVNSAIAAVLACFALFTGRSYFDIRPAGFSNLLVGVFILILVLSTYKNILYIWLIVPLTVLWCNLHGGYIYVFITLVPFIVLHFITSFSKKWFVSISRKGVYHTIAASMAAFIAMIIFNPFHLTNLTHTFVISVSKHAEMWRTVNEWHPAFEWSNPVGTSYPFLILFALFIGLLLFWIFSRILAPRYLTGSKSQLDSQKVSFDILFKFFGFLLALFAFWLVLLSFAVIDCNFWSMVISFSFGVILLVSIYQNIYYIFLSIPLFLLILQITGLYNPNAVKIAFAGRNIYAFVLLPGYVFMHIIGSALSKNLEIKRKKIAYVAVAVFFMILMVILFNPFKNSLPPWQLFKVDAKAYLENIITIMGNKFVPSRGIWHPQFINNAEPAYQYYFYGLLVINAIAIALWFIFPVLLGKENSNAPGNYPQPVQAKGTNYQLPKIDLPLIAVVLLTIFMAIQSRRFIPIAAIAACPILAMFIDQIIKNISSSLNFHKNKRFEVPAMQVNVQKFLITAAAVITAFLGTSWVLKFKTVYLNPWPTDTKFTSVFMRMTASDAKPFYAMKFIKDNKLSGKMFNYWTEGGFIAWGEEPDPNTGQIPLKLFIDGRAQAAYEPSAYELWVNIMNGGPEVARARQVAGPYAGPDEYKKYVDYQKVGVWINQQLIEQGVWIVLMPAEQFDEDFVKGLETHADWRLIYYDNKQRIYADKKHFETGRLIKGVFDGATVFPNEIFRNLMLSYLKIFSTNQKDQQEGLDIAIKTFNSNWADSLVQKIIAGSRGEIQPEITGFCKSVFEDFEKNKSNYTKQDGYHSNLASILYITRYLRTVAEKENNKDKLAFYQSKYLSYDIERQELQNTKRW